MADIHDVVVVGSGAGGATVAREAVRRGLTVALIERGGRFPWMGGPLTLAAVLDRGGLTRSREGRPVVFGDNYGGLSNLSAGCAVPPPQEMFLPLGIDLSAEAAEAEADLHIQPLPDALVGAVNLRLMAAAGEAGLAWKKIPKFIDPARCRPDCGRCMMGCPTGAKWSARVYGDEAVAAGARLMTRTRIDRVIVEDGRAVGVAGRRRGRAVRVYGRAVVLAAGAGNVGILRRAGIAEAGGSFCCDWLQFVGAKIPGQNTVRANPMSVGSTDTYAAQGLVVMPVFPSWAQFGVLLAMTGAAALPRLADYWQYTGCMVKIRDEKIGTVGPGRAFFKPVTPADRRRLDAGVDIIKAVFRKAGADMDSIFVMDPIGAHPSAACPIGKVVDANLETAVGGLYCCDASVFPDSLGLPTVWTIVSLGKRLAGHLAGKLATPAGQPAAA